MSEQLPHRLSHRLLAQGLLTTVLAAGRLQLQHFQAGTTVALKADNSPVTVADRESETMLLATLQRLAPGVPVIAEEAMAAGQAPSVATGTDDCFFLVDPLDGTREFVAGRPEFTINVALVVGARPRFGLIYAPASSLFVVTLADDEVAEATVAPDSDARSTDDLALAALRSRAPDAGGLVAVASRSHNSPGTDAFLGQYRIKARKAAGSSLKFCLLARGDADIYPRLGPTNEWDTAAGHAILAAAGGTVTTLDGAPLCYGKSAQRFRNPDFVAWGRGPLPPTE